MIFRQYTPHLMRPQATIAILVASALIIPSRSLLACCDDFWSCAEAVATAGLSCAAEEALKALEKILNSARAQRDEINATTQDQIAAQNAALQPVLDQQQRVIDKTRAEVQISERILEVYDKNVAGRVKNGVSEAAPDIAKTTGEAKQPGGSTAVHSSAIAKTTEGRSAASQSSSSGQNKLPHPAIVLDPTVEQLRKELVALLTEEAKLEEATKLLQAKAANVKQDAVAETVKRIDNLAIAPLSEVINAIGVDIGHPDKVTDLPGHIGTVVDDIPKVLSTELTGAYDVLHQHYVVVAQMPAASLEKLDALRLQIAGVNNEIAGLLRKERVTEAESLRALLHRPAGSTVRYVAAQHLVRKATSPRLIALSANLHPTVAAWGSELEPYTKPLQGHDTSGYPAKMAPQWNRYFTGKNKAAIVRERNALLAEARQHFARKPETLKSVEALIRREAAARSGT